MTSLSDMTIYSFEDMEDIFSRHPHEYLFYEAHCIRKFLQTMTISICGNFDRPFYRESSGKYLEYNARCNLKECVELEKNPFILLKQIRFRRRVGSLQRSDLPLERNLPFSSNFTLILDQERILKKCRFSIMGLFKGRSKIPFPLGSLKVDPLQYLRRPENKRVMMELLLRIDHLKLEKEDIKAIIISTEIANSGLLPLKVIKLGIPILKI